MFTRNHHKLIRQFLEHKERTAEKIDAIDEYYKRMHAAESLSSYASIPPSITSMYQRTISISFIYCYRLFSRILLSALSLSISLISTCSCPNLFLLLCKISAARVIFLTFRCSSNSGTRESYKLSGLFG